jgi:diaminohydroxyphosphoribosylaminopyrimidine deaminase / 5-amino-6-(5-phosphoribosylamino)uracil reductase
MQRAISLAKLGNGNVAPNPKVGAVIVYNDIIIGEGYHQEYGKAHSEVNAINSVVNKELLGKSTIYVTLEPCSHYGKTPPCANLIVESKIPKVVIGCTDSNPEVAGKGISLLKNAGIDVIEGVLENECVDLNKRFFTFINKKRPYIILKWAQTSDGFIAKENFDSKWISCAESRMWVHKWRTEEHAILVGKNTALYDNPSLTARDWEGKNPIRIVLDFELSLPSNLAIFSDNQAETICFNFHKNTKETGVEYVKITKTDNYLNEILAELYNRKISSLIIEGGAKTLQTFINAELWDEARIFTAKINFEKGIKAPILTNSIKESEMYLSNDLLTIYRNYKK